LSLGEQLHRLKEQTGSPYLSNPAADSVLRVGNSSGYWARVWGKKGKHIFIGGASLFVAGSLGNAFVPTLPDQPEPQHLGVASLE